MGAMDRSIIFGGVALVLTVFVFVLELVEEDEEELDRSMRESWRAMSVRRRLEFFSMVFVAAGLMAGS
jgi:hypothetical protein